MHDGRHPQRRSRISPAGLAAVAILLSGVLVAGCGGGSPSPTARTTGAATPGRSSAAARTGSHAGSSTRSSAGPPEALAFAKCMRSNGVSSFPDPSPGGGFAFQASSAIVSSPAFRTAQAKCAKLMPGPGAGGESFPAQVKAHALAQLRGVAQCMRRHGIPDFPDPRTTRPANLSLGEYSEITDYEGVFLLFPATIDMQSPAWERAAAACGPLAESFDHAHH
jgi:hypothetical protein